MSDHNKDPREQERLARDLASELAEIFVTFVRGDIDFAEVSFAAYDVLQDLHVVASGEYELASADQVEDDEEEMEDLSGELQR